MSDEPRPWRIREAAPDDLPFLVEMARLFDPPEKDRSTADWGRPGDYALVAVNRDGRRIGAVWYRHESPPGMSALSQQYHREVFIGVTKSEQRGGVGCALMEGLISHAGQERPRVDALIALVRPENRGAVAICRRFQFEQQPPPKEGRWLRLLV